jgi:hypothetical protein
VSPAQRDAGSIIRFLGQSALAGMVRIDGSEVKQPQLFAHAALLGFDPGHVGEVSGTLFVAGHFPLGLLSVGRGDPVKLARVSRLDFSPARRLAAMRWPSVSVGPFLRLGILLLRIFLAHA